MRDQSAQKKGGVPEDSIEKHSLLQSTPELSIQKPDGRQRASPAIAFNDQRERPGLMGFPVHSLAMSHLLPQISEMPTVLF